MKVLFIKRFSQFSVNLAIKLCNSNLMYSRTSYSKSKKDYFLSDEFHEIGFLDQIWGSTIRGALQEVKAKFEIS